MNRGSDEGRKPTPPMVAGEMEGDGPYISVRVLTHAYLPSAEAIADVSFDVREGEFVCIVGPSGCGKSTLLNILSGLLEPTSGDVTIAGRRLYDQIDGNDEVMGGYVFQDHRLLPWKTVRQNLEFALLGSQIPKIAWETRIQEMLRLLQISEFEHAWPLALSGGQRQRVSIARALAVDPQFLLMDEPFSTLDEVTARTMRIELLRLWQATGRTTIFVTHSIREAVYLADRILILTRGPGRIHRVVEVPVPRPRDYEDPRLTEIEGDIVHDVLAEWGHKDPASGL